MPALTKLAQLLAELEAKMPAIKEAAGQNPALQRLFNLQTHSPEGKPLGPVLDQATVERFNNATPVLRRKSVADLAGPQLQTVHTSNKTGSAAGAKKAIEKRTEIEPSQFGGHPVFGSLVEDLYSPLSSRLDMRYPDKGSPIIRPDNILSQYGRYGMVPKSKEGLTYTLGDSLDHAWSHPVGIDTYLANPDFASGHYEGSAISDLAKRYLEAKHARNLELGLTKDGQTPGHMRYDEAEALHRSIENEPRIPNMSKWLESQGLQGISGHYRDWSNNLDGIGASPRLGVRTFGEAGSPLSPMEDKDLPSMLQSLKGNDPYNYLEVQGHGLKPENVDRVLDYGLEPSSAVEKKLRKLGIRYEPLSVQDTPLKAFNDLSLKGGNADDFQSLARELGQEKVEKALEYWKDRSAPPKVGQNYKRGGAVHKRPTEAQKQAGNYPKKHVRLLGMRLSIETPKGHERSGVSHDGKLWARKMTHDYGYIRGTMGRDKDHIDVFLGPHALEAGKHPVFIIDQVHPHNGDFDEHKVMLGFKSRKDASVAYHDNYEPGWRGVGAINTMNLRDFKAWAFEPGRRVKPLAEHSAEKRSVQKFAEGGAVFGHYPQMKRRAEKNNDRKAAADMPIQALRGWAAGTAGLPGDLEGLVRMLPGLDSTPRMPTSDFYKEWLPGATDSPAGKAAVELGSLFGGVGAGRAASAIRKGAGKLGTAAAEQIAKGMEGEGALSAVLRPAAPAYAVKPKGGNWTDHDREIYLDQILGFGGEPSTALDDWGRKHIGKYIKNDLGTATDPLLQLEREGKLHLDPDQLAEIAENGGYGVSNRPRTNADGSRYFNLMVRRGSTEYTPSSQFHIRETGRKYRTPWENLADSQVQKRTPSETIQELADLYSVDGDISSAKSAAESMIKDNVGTRIEDARQLIPQWLDKLNPSDPVYGLMHPMEDALQFDHVMDYMRAARNAGDHFANAPGLNAIEDPDALALINRGLHLSESDLGKTSFPQAVAKTSEWNKLLAAQKAQVDLNKGIKKVHRTYDDTGHQWVELSPEGLKAEGDAMRHCVGGYCSQVESGDTRILSLRGKDGKPAATVEVGYESPYLLRGELTQIGSNRLPPEVRNAYQEAFTQSGKHGMHYAKDMVPWLEQNYPDIHKQVTTKDAVIRQIKGPANRAPSADILPHVQDLVKNGLGEGLGNWSQVGDLRNTGLIKGNPGTSTIGSSLDGSRTQVTMPDAPYYTRRELADHFESQGIPRNDARRHAGDVEGLLEDGNLGYAQGGSVQRFDDGGGVDLFENAYKPAPEPTTDPWASTNGWVPPDDSYEKNRKSWRTTGADGAGFEEGADGGYSRFQPGSRNEIVEEYDNNGNMIRTRARHNSSDLSGLAQGIATIAGLGLGVPSLMSGLTGLAAGTPFAVGSGAATGAAAAGAEAGLSALTPTSVGSFGPVASVTAGAPAAASTFSMPSLSSLFNGAKTINSGLGMLKTLAGGNSGGGGALSQAAAQPNYNLDPWQAPSALGNHALRAPEAAITPGAPITR